MFDVHFDVNVGLIEQVIMSKLFEWYGKDFASSDISLLRTLASYLPFTSRLRANLLAARGRLVHGRVLRFAYALLVSPLEIK